MTRHLWPTMLVLAADFLSGCGGNVRHSTITARISGVEFSLEVARDDAAQAVGLAGRSEIAERGGMLFVFCEPEVQAFTMRDCLIPLDLIYLDASQSLLFAATMQPETPRTSRESAGTPEADAEYDARLKVYPSSQPVKFAIELREGTIKKLNIRDGDRIEFTPDPCSAAAK